ncbi:hypothetical protein EJ06DRAFT_299501 [Trichodelitschia bisporula]|uniref:Nudix hydrolase domain-containing protein n=1 Tax=Trichodelitschia bisporula TaxID=703511 RepID=A0A6G1I6V8_9PEZI|nr:hypothetical protein EJ06DRAFT_299501 [Trichodelitschia bisporula]
MANMRPHHTAAIARLRDYTPPPTTYFSLPLSRRAAVLILLYADRGGDLRVVLTMRAKTLKSYAGQAALPGGKADTVTETPFTTARREAEEEIGLPASPGGLPQPWRITHLAQLPTNLARTELGVRPCVALLAPDPAYTPPPGQPLPLAEDVLIPRLDAREVAAVFSAPLRDFLRVGRETRGQPWYEGVWIDWYATAWRMHNFYVPVESGPVVWAPERGNKGRPVVAGSSLPYRDIPQQRARGKDEGARMGAGESVPVAVGREAARLVGQEEEGGRALSAFRVFGMTARILVDCARVAYGEEPEFEHNSHFGDEELIGKLIKSGRLAAERTPGAEITREDLLAASKI